MELHYLNKNPFVEFRKWFKEAEEKAGMNFPSAMALATVDKHGQPGVRMVLLKEMNEKGFSFFTHYSGRKGKELHENQKASAVFYWDKLGRQVRIEGVVEKLAKEESESYFHSRPRLAQIGAYASPQSEAIASREWLEKRIEEFEKKFQGVDPVPLPPHWGGFRLKPERIEFWVERPHRLHDRFLYEKQKGEGWTISRLAP